MYLMPRPKNTRPDRLVESLIFYEHIPVLKHVTFLDKNKVTAFICLINHGISPSNMYSCMGIRYAKLFEAA